MRRLALLLAGGALWLLFMAAPAFADGGPHALGLNNGTSGLSGDCAACHRAHTAQAADLLKASMPGLCLTCHDGTGATTDVEDGIQYTPDGAGDPTTTVLGALRGGGFEYALMDTSNAARLSYNSRNGISLTFGAAPAAGSVTLTIPAFGTWAAQSITFSAPLSVGAIQNAVNAAYGTSTTYTSSTAAGSMTGTQTVMLLVAVNAGSNVITLTPHNEFRLYTIPLPTVGTGDNTTGETLAITNGIAIGNVSKVGVRAVGAANTAVTSMHEGVGTVWGNGPQSQDNPGATGVALECTSCHNPHGNGQYRILSTHPGEDWANDASHASTTLAANVTTGAQTVITVASATGFPTTEYVIRIGTEDMLVTGGQGTTTWTVTRGYNGTTPGAPASGTAVAMLINDWTPPANAVEVKDGVALAAGQVRNYTVRPSTNGLTTGVVAGGATSGDYWRYKYDPTGAANFTNFYLKPDEMNTGWDGIKPTNKAANGGVAPANTNGLMTAWCITCHTRYDGNRLTTGANGGPGGTPSLNAQSPMDAIFKYKHGTTSTGCELCHVSHGSNALMTAQFSASALFPDGTPEDSALLKVNNRGTCNLCHDPTGTVTAGTTVGTVPGAITPGP